MFLLRCFETKKCIFKYFLSYFIFEYKKYANFKPLTYTNLQMALFKDFYKRNQNLLGNRFLIFSLILLPILFRQGIYRSIITYRINQERIADTQMNAQIERYILTHPDVYDRQFDNMDKIIHISLKLTSDALSFTGDPKLKTDPLSTLQIGETNSEGFAAFFNTVCTYLIHRYHFSDDYTCQQFVAERTKGGTNLQNAFQSPYGGDGVGTAFNKTRDVVRILERATGRYKYVDPAIFEQVSIVYVYATGATSDAFTDKPRSRNRLVSKP